MEFSGGTEEICPLCGFGDDSELELDPLYVCQICRTRCTLSDQRFLNYWTEFANPKWSTKNYPSCTNCFIKEFGLSHPDFEASGWAPDTYLVWKEALNLGVDISPRIPHIEMTNGIRRLASCALSRNDIIRWLSSDCHIDEAELWSKLFDEFDEAISWRDAGFAPDEAEWWSDFFGEFDLAIAWRDAGFTPDEETTGEWLKWGCTPDIASRFVDQGMITAPEIGFKEIGVTLDDAVFYETQEFSTYKFSSDGFYIGLWLPSDLSRAQIVSLRDQLFAREEVFQALNHNNNSRLVYEHKTFQFWDALPCNFESLKEVGLPITAANLERYWGLSCKEILNVIDSGGEPGVAAGVVRLGGSLSNLGIIEQLLDLGMKLPSATLLTQRGFLPKHLNYAENLGVIRSILMDLEEILEADYEMEIDEALKWIEIEASVSEVKLWKTQGFAPQEAVKWSNEGFEPEAARRWHDAGADSPVTAKRRRDAGLQP